MEIHHLRLQMKTNIHLTLHKSETSNRLAFVTICFALRIFVNSFILFAPVPPSDKAYKCSFFECV